MLFYNTGTETGKLVSNIELESNIFGIIAAFENGLRKYGKRWEDLAEADIRPFGTVAADSQFSYAKKIIRDQLEKYLTLMGKDETNLGIDFYLSQDNIFVKENLNKAIELYVIAEDAERLYEIYGNGNFYDIIHKELENFCQRKNMPGIIVSKDL